MRCRNDCSSCGPKQSERPCRIPRIETAQPWVSPPFARRCVYVNITYIYVYVYEYVYVYVYEYVYVYVYVNVYVNVYVCMTTNLQLDIYAGAQAVHARALLCCWVVRSGPAVKFVWTCLPFLLFIPKHRFALGLLLGWTGFGVWILCLVGLQV